MPANLTPQYQKAEAEYRRAQSAQEQIECLELMLKLIPKHKGTEKLQADLKTKLKEAREESEVEKKAPKGGKSYRFPRQGAGTVVIIGGPNAGKSQILASLTKAEPAVAPFPFSTREPMPGMMAWKDAHVQLIDTPPITDTMFEPYILGFVRSADAVILCMDGGSDDGPEQAAEVVKQFQQRKTEFGGESGFVDDDFSRVRIRTLFAVTRGDDPDASTRIEFFREMCDAPLEPLLVELSRPDSVEQLRKAIFDALSVIRIYTKKPGKPAEKVDPFTIPVGGTVEDLAAKVHRDLAESVKHARIWGTSAHDGQTVGKEHVLADEDVVELHT